MSALAASGVIALWCVALFCTALYLTINPVKDSSHKLADGGGRTRAIEADGGEDRDGRGLSYSKQSHFVGPRTGRGSL